jgi:excisionase family DNA binding protein
MDMQTLTSPSLLTIDEAAARLRSSTQTVRRLVARGDLPVVQLAPGGRLRFRDDDVDAVIERARTTRGANDEHAD